MNKLKEKLNTKKDDDQLYGDLLATKLRRISSSGKLHAKMKLTILCLFRVKLAAGSLP